MNIKVLNKVLCALAVAYVPCLFLFPLFIDQASAWWQTPYYLNLLACFLISFPFYLVFIEICFTVGRLADRRPYRRSEQVLNAVTNALAVAIMITALLASSFAYVTVALSVILILLWIIGGIIFKRRSAVIDTLMQKSFYIYLLVAFVILATVSFFVIRSTEDKGKVDDADVGMTSQQEML